MSSAAQPSLVDALAAIVEARALDGFDELPVGFRVRLLPATVAEAACLALLEHSPETAERVWPRYVTAAELLFDELVEALDLPHVGPVKALPLEGVLRLMIRPAVEGFARRLTD